MMLRGNLAKSPNEGGRESEAEGYRAAPPSHLEHHTTGALTAGDSSQNLIEVVAGRSSGEPSGNPEPSQGGQVGKGLDLQQPPAGAAGVSDTGVAGEGSQRRKREREGAPGARDATCPSSGSVPSSLAKNLTAGFAGADVRAPGVKLRKNADSPLPANQTARKQPNVEPEIMAARMMNPLTRTIVCEGYPDEELTHQQLPLVN
ncbi:hypothetical protein TSAR_014775 [Trichomalopsis sarcophagae]|uniref:Uncharacterized protein n=1 Tax=Trichomalopsis sarcophagae TaxID=543379 RepID=A0A232FKH7_9HYME|nr:hypothetical protein TSAR_014775 [Trichomalopsis sarcophagae]